MGVPDRFADIVGQDQTIDRLRGALAAGRLPHGLLFAGPGGVGKFTTAAALASAFLGDTDEVARRVANGTHPDIHVVTRQLIRQHDSGGKSKAIDLSVKVLRPELIEPANRGSVEGGGKVFVIEEAETMNASAQNALLKTLEEPHGRTLIILLTDQPESLLPTYAARTCSLISRSRAVNSSGVSVPSANICCLSTSSGSRSLSVESSSAGR